MRRFAPRVKLLAFSPRRGKVAAINDGVRTVTSDIIVFSDANTFLEPGAIRALVRNFADAQVGAVSGDVALTGDRASLGWSEDLHDQCERWVQRAESEIGSMIGADGARYAIRRELFCPPPTDTILDDMSIPMAVVRAGRRVVFEPTARAFEQGSETAREEFARKCRVIAGAIQFMKRSDSAVPAGAPQVVLSLVSHKALRWLSPVFASAAFMSSVALAGVSHSYALAAAAQITLVVLVLAGCAPRLRRVGVVAIAHYFCLLESAAAIGFLRGVFARQSVLWRRFARARAMPVGAAMSCTRRRPRVLVIAYAFSPQAAIGAIRTAPVVRQHRESRSLVSVLGKSVVHRLRRHAPDVIYPSARRRTRHVAAAYGWLASART